MKRNRNTSEFALQVAIMLACLIILTVRFSDVPTSAQTLCGGEPPVQNPGRPLSEAWPQGKTISVVVFDTPE